MFSAAIKTLPLFFATKSAKNVQRNGLSFEKWTLVSNALKKDYTVSFRRAIACILTYSVQ